MPEPAKKSRMVESPFFNDNKKLIRLSGLANPIGSSLLNSSFIKEEPCFVVATPLRTDGGFILSRSLRQYSFPLSLK